MSAKPTHAHGALFDSFPQGLQSLHGGARFDEGFQLQEKGSPKGDKFDEFGQPSEPDQTGHGPVWDEWGWKDMPDIHGGLLYDDGFGEETAHETSRGPLFDLFEPSTQVKFIYDGQDAEGIVNQVRSDGIVMVTPRKGGKPVEVGLEQFLAYRSPSMDNAGTTAEASEAEAPSAWSSDARGGTHNQIPVPGDAGVPSGSIEPGSPIEATPQGSSVPANARDSIDADWSPIRSLKSALGEELDVAKAASTPLDHLHAAAGHLARGGENRLLKANGHLQGALDHHDFHPGSESFSHTHRALEHTENALLGGRGRTPEEHTARALHHTQTAERLHKIGKAVLSPLDVLKAPNEHEIGLHNSGYRMSRGPNPSAVDHWSNRSGQRIGASVEHTPGKVAAGYHYENGQHKTLAGPFGSHSEAHNAIVAHHEGLDEMSGRIRNHAVDTGQASTRDVSEKTVRLPSELLKSCSAFDGEPAVRKEVTVAESAIQAQEGASTLAGGKGAGSTYCPECREQKSLTDDGRCPDCNMVLDSHEPGKAKREKGDGNGQGESSATKTFGTVGDLAKAFGAAGDPGAGGQTVTTDGSRHQRGQQTGQAKGYPSDEPVEERAHPESDHNSTTEESHSAGATCPHCGQPLKELDEKTEQGAPTHKCVEGFLDTLKSNPSIGGASWAGNAQAAGLAAGRTMRGGAPHHSAEGKLINEGDHVEHLASGLHGPAKLGRDASAGPYVTVEQNGQRGGGPAHGFKHVVGKTSDGPLEVLKTVLA